MAFNPTANYTTTIDAEGNLFIMQGGVVYDQNGNSWTNVPTTKKNGWSAPIPSSFMIGTAAQMLTLTLGAGNVGMVWFASDLNCEFIGKLNPVTGNTYYWAPRGGRQSLYSRSGSLTTPLATLSSGITSGTFTLPGSGNLTIPANLLVAGISRLAFQLHFKRVGATATLTMNVRLGTNGTTSDNTVIGSSVAGATPEIRSNSECGVTSSTSYTTLMGLVINTNSLAVAADRTTAFSTASANIITVDLSGVNASDGPFNLMSLQVDLLG